MLERAATCPVETRLIAGARHAPHLEARQATLEAICRSCGPCRWTVAA